MEYRIFNKNGEKVSLLGFGTMRLPVVDGDSDKIDYDEATAMIRAAIDGGVNYVDTAYMYHGGNSEGAVARALKDGYREKVLLADKLPVWSAREAGGCEALFETQLARLETDCIDMYLLHNLTKKFWKMAQEQEALKMLEKKKAEGKLRYIGFSFHDDFDTFKEIIDAYPWDFCQIQFNYMDMNIQAGVRGLRYAGEKGVQVVIMEPLKGGKLTVKVPEEVKAFFESAPVKKSPAEWALRYVADFPEVLTILSGMSTMEQVEDNLRILAEGRPGSLSQEEQDIIKGASEIYNKLIKAPCTECGYCMPCPFGVYIPDVISHYNEWFLYGEPPRLLFEYGVHIGPKHRAAVCSSCGACLDKCPQHLPIPDIMAESNGIFEK